MIKVVFWWYFRAAHKKNKYPFRACVSGCRSKKVFLWGDKREMSQNNTLPGDIWCPPLLSLQMKVQMRSIVWSDSSVDVLQSWILWTCVLDETDFCYSLGLTVKSDSLRHVLWRDTGSGPRVFWGGNKPNVPNVWTLISNPCRSKHTNRSRLHGQWPHHHHFSPLFWLNLFLLLLLRPKWE